ncbi:MAG: O-antigen ligase family protein [Chloroflexota bacterium]
MSSWIANRQQTSRFTWVGLAIATGMLMGVLAVVGPTRMHMPALPLLVPAGLVFGVVTLHRPEYSILLVIGLTNSLVAPDVLPIFNFGPLGVSIPELILGFLLLLTFLRVTSHPDFSLFISPLAVPLAFFLIGIILASLYALIVQDVQLGHIIPQLRNYSFWMLFFIVIHLLREPAQIDRFLKGLWLLTAVLCVGALLPGVFNQTPFMNSETPTLATAEREFGGVTRLFFYGERLLYVMIPVTVATLALVRRQSTSLYLILLVMLLGWLYFSFQRNYWLTTIINLGALGWILIGEALARMIRRLIPLLLIAVFALVVLQITQPNTLRRQGEAAVQRVLSLTNDPARTDSSTRWRLTENRYAFDIVAENPLTGIGVANAYRPRMVDELETPLDRYVHNAYLWIAVNTGLVNLGLFFAFCGLYLYRVLRYWPQIARDDYRAAYLGFGMAFLGMMISNLVAPNFIQSPALSIYPAMIGLSEVIWRINPAPQPERITQ